MMCRYSGGRDGFVLKWDNKRVNQAPRFGDENEEELCDEVTDEWDFDVCSSHKQKQTVQHNEHAIQYNYLTHPS